MALAPPPEEPIIDMGEEESENNLNPFLLPPPSTSPELTPPPLPPRVTTYTNTGSSSSRGTAHATDSGGIPEGAENSGGDMVGRSRINPFAGPVAQPSPPQELSEPAESSVSPPPPPPPPPPATRRPSQSPTTDRSPSETMPPSVTPPEGSTSVVRRRGSDNNSGNTTTSNSASRPGLPASAGSTSRPSRSPTRRGSARSTNTTVVDPPAWISARPPPPFPAPAATIPPIPTATPVPAPTVARVSASHVPLPNASTSSSGAATRSSSSPPANEQGAGTWSWGGIGRSFIGAMFGPSAVGRHGEGSRAEDATPRPRAVRELTAHIMQQTADGKYNVSVWRRNKQDGRSTKVSIGLYDSAYEGQRAAEAFAPPKWQEPTKDSRCAVCNSTFGFLLKRRHHCRNCGRLVCSSCAETTWPRNMLPPTYISDQNERKIRVCSTCYNAGEQFRRALLAGSGEQAMEAYSTGCINLRVPYTIYHNELPVHCAAAGGNLNILAWLVEDRCCPLFLDRDKKVALGDSRRLSVMGAAAASGHIQIMRYLAFTQGCKVTEIRDMNTLWNALEKCIFEGADVPTEATGLQQRLSGGGTFIGDRNDTTGGYPGSTVRSVRESGGSGAEVAAAIDDDDNMCIVCFERKVDCTLVPCGHHCCCMICAAQFEHCPVCRAEVTQKIRAISV